MNAASKLALETAAKAKALKRDYHGGYRPFPDRLPGVTLRVHTPLVAKLVSDGLMSWVNECKSAAVITDDGRAALENTR